MYYITLIKIKTISFKCKKCGSIEEKPIYRMVYHDHEESEIKPLINMNDYIDKHIEIEDESNVEIDIDVIEIEI